MEVAPDFDEFIACLTARGVEFVIPFGAYALAFHGAPRFTGDLDVLIRPTTRERLGGYCRLWRSSAFRLPSSRLKQRLTGGESSRWAFRQSRFTS